HRADRRPVVEAEAAHRCGVVVARVSVGTREKLLLDHENLMPDAAVFREFVGRLDDAAAGHRPPGHTRAPPICRHSGRSDAPVWTPAHAWQRARPADPGLASMPGACMSVATCR